jgi:hypothetical protein
MFAGRIGAIVMSKKNKGRRRRRRSEEEIELLKTCESEAIEDRDIRENSNARIRFRKIPWPFWIMGSLFILGAVFVVFMIYDELIVFKHHR